MFWLSCSSMIQIRGFACPPQHALAGRAQHALTWTPVASAANLSLAALLPLVDDQQWVNQGVLRHHAMPHDMPSKQLAGLCQGQHLPRRSLNINSNAHRSQLKVGTGQQQHSSVCIPSGILYGVFTTSPGPSSSHRPWSLSGMDNFLRVSIRWLLSVKAVLQLYDLQHLNLPGLRRYQ